MEIPGRLTMYTDFTQRLRQGIVIGKYRAAIAVATQGLAGEKAGAAQGTQVAAFASLIRCTKTLRRVFNNNQAMTRGNVVDRIHVATLSVQRHRHQRDQKSTRLNSSH